MHMHRLIGAACFVAFTAPAWAASPIDGTWKADVKSAKLPDKADSYMLRNGVYSCETCAPPFTVKADGAFHKVSGSPYTDEIAIKVVSPRQIDEVDRKNGKITSKSSVTVSPDNESAAFTFTSYSAGGAPVTGSGKQVRVGAIPAGAHVMSGKWRTVSYSGISDNGVTMKMKLDGDMLHFSSPTGSSYNARIGAGQAPVKGDPGWTTTSVTRSGPNGFVETDYRNGKAIGMQTMTISHDGKSMTVVAEDKLRGTRTTYMAWKQ